MPARLVSFPVMSRSISHNSDTIERAAADGKPSIIDVGVDQESMSSIIAGAKEWRNLYYLQD